MIDPANQPYPDRSDTVAAFAAHVDAGKVAAFDAMGVELVMGERRGPRFQDAFSGRWLYNCHSNGGVFNLGHRHPAIIDAVRAGLDHLDIGNHHLISGWRARLAVRLAATTDGHLPGVVFGVGGGESVDLAIKVARAATGRTGVVSVLGGYHGHTGYALATGDSSYRDPFGPQLPGFVQVPFDDLEALDRVLDDTVAAVIIETIPATLGMPIASASYLAGVQQRCRDRGVVFILDEVQTGLGRTGPVWAYRHDGLEPDVVITGKGLSGGIYPITAALMTAELHRVLDERPFVHVSTFGGSELGCLAALAVLDVIEAPGFASRVEELGRRFADGFADLDVEIRRRGLFIGLAFAEPAGAMPVARDLIDAGVFAIFANNDPSVLQFLPSLVLTDDEADEIIAIVHRVVPVRPTGRD